jgi:hypothetical protein
MFILILHFPKLNVMLTSPDPPAHEPTCGLNVQRWLKSLLKFLANEAL